MILIFILIGVSLGIYLFLNQAIFGKLPSGKRLERILNSKNYQNGSFKNLSVTPDLAPDASYWKILKMYMNKPKDAEPKFDLPSVKTDLKNLDTEHTQIVWFGHSSYLLKTNGIHILVDPVFSGNASPVSFFAKSYKGANTYQIEDFPEIDIVLLTHDHYDHLDYKTILKLKDKAKFFYASLGVGAHLNAWGIDDSRIVEFDWWDEHAFNKDIKFIAAPARHFSGRKFKRNQSLWASYLLQTPTEKLYLGGDSGYDFHFKEIGEKHGPFDLAILECGQYNSMWPYIHMVPEDLLKATHDLKAKVLMPVHWGKFTLALHPWNEPIKRVTARANELNTKISTPKMGEPVILNAHLPNEAWW